MDKYNEMLAEIKRFEKRVRKLRDAEDHLYMPARAAVKRSAIDLKKEITKFVRRIY